MVHGAWVGWLTRRVLISSVRYAAREESTSRFRKPLQEMHPARPSFWLIETTAKILGRTSILASSTSCTAHEFSVIPPIRSRIRPASILLHAPAYLKPRRRSGPGQTTAPGRSRYSNSNTRRSERTGTLSRSRDPQRRFCPTRPTPADSRRWSQSVPLVPKRSGISGRPQSVVKFVERLFAIEKRSVCLRTYPGRFDFIGTEKPMFDHSRPTRVAVRLPTRQRTGNGRSTAMHRSEPVSASRVTQPLVTSRS